jgi:hypothetical protein
LQFAAARERAAEMAVETRQVPLAIRMSPLWWFDDLGLDQGKIDQALAARDEPAGMKSTQKLLIALRQLARARFDCANEASEAFPFRRAIPDRQIQGVETTEPERQCHIRNSCRDDPPEILCQGCLVLDPPRLNRHGAPQYDYCASGPDFALDPISEILTDQ